MEGAEQRKTPETVCRNRLARCAVRHAVPARYRNRSLPLRLQMATAPPPSCPTADRSTTCITAAATAPNQPRRQVIAPTSNAINCTAKSSTHRVNSPAATNSTLLGSSEATNRHPQRPDRRRQSQNKVAAGLSQTAVKRRSYGYDRTGNLTHSTDQRTGTTKFEYDRLGPDYQAGNELFASTPRSISLSDGLNAIPDNRLKTYNGTTYYYDELGNLIHHERWPTAKCRTISTICTTNWLRPEIFKKDGSKRLGPTPTTPWAEKI